MTIQIGGPTTPSSPTQRAQIVADLGLPTAAVLSALVAGAGTPPSAAQVAALSAQLFTPAGQAKRLTMQAIQYLGSATSQFLTVPDDVTVLDMEGTGRGGGGGGNGGGGGSAGQQMYRRSFPVIPGETLTINVPPGGAAGASGANAGSPVPDGPSGSVLTVTGSLSGLLVALTAGGGGRANGQSGDASGPRFNTGNGPVAAGTAGTPGNAWITENSPYGNVGGMGGTGAESTGAAITAGGGGRSTNTVQAGTGGNTGAVAGQRAGGGGGAGWPDMSVGTGESGGNGGGHNVAGQPGKTFGAGGGGGGTGQPGGAGNQAMLRVYM